MRPTRLDAYRLMHDGALALAAVESAGIRVDVERLNRTIEEVTERIAASEQKLKSDSIWKIWKRHFGGKASLGSRAQLGTVLFDLLGMKSGGVTPSGRSKVDEETLTAMDSEVPFVSAYLELERLKKLRSTYLVGIRREVSPDGFLHPSFNLHMTITYRSSSDRPNFQNIPIRNKDIGRLIRSCFVPRRGRVLVEIDYKAIEVCIAACYHKDPAMIAYIEDPSKDMHRDMAMECYVLGPDEVTKETRFYAKNQFVFPQFYGDYYLQCAPNLWKAIERARLTTASGVPLKKHLRRHGIRELGSCDPGPPAKGTFVNHIRMVEERFWGKRFQRYAQWKLDWYEKYRRTGRFRLLTGFEVEGLYKKNQVINAPVQGVAFHCLLWSLIRLVKWLRRNRMRSMIVGQIHDSIEADVVPDELEDFIAEANWIMTAEIRRHWPWIVVPLTIEVETSEQNWWEKRPYEH